MELTKEQVEKLEKVLKTKKQCQNCGSTSPMDLSATEYQLTSTERNNHSLTVGGSMTFMPLVAGVCPDCGNVLLFNLKTIGIVNK